MECTLTITKIEIELPADVNMILDYENAVREKIMRAICYCDKAYDKYVLDYDETKERTYIQYVGLNNQYKWALSEPIPYGEFDYIQDISMFLVILVMH